MERRQWGWGTRVRRKYTAVLGSRTKTHPAFFWDLSLISRRSGPNGTAIQDGIIFIWKVQPSVFPALSFSPCARFQCCLTSPERLSGALQTHNSKMTLSSFSVPLREWSHHSLLHKPEVWVPTWTFPSAPSVWQNFCFDKYLAFYSLVPICIASRLIQKCILSHLVTYQILLLFFCWDHAWYWSTIKVEDMVWLCPWPNNHSHVSKI